MTAATMSRLPISAGGALLGSLSRGGRWSLARAMDLAHWGLAQFMRAPVAITCVVAIAGFSVLAGSNALFMQSGRHPAPLFFSAPKPAIAVKPVVPAVRPRPQPAAIDQETTGSVAPRPATDVVGGEEVKALQQKLAQLKFFDGTPDGLFGRRTATAIKAFEIKAGMKPTGKLTRRIIDAVLGAPAPTAQPLPAATVPAAPAPTMAATPATTRPAIVPATTALADATPVPLAPRRIVVPTTVVSAPAPAATDSPGDQPAPADAVASNALPSATAGDDIPPQAAPAAPPATASLPAVMAPALPGPTVTVASIAPVVASPAPVAAAPLPVVAQAPAPAATPAATVPQGQTVMAMNNPADAPTPAADAGTSAAQKLAAQMGTLPPSATAVNTTSDPGDGAGSTDPVLITKIQRGLASLGFLGAKIDGVPGEGTAKAIRNFEVFYDYRVTGLASPQLLNLLIQHGAVI